MYFQLGKDYVINTDDIIGIFDLENTTVSQRTREFLAYAQKNGAVIPLSEDIPKSFILTDYPVEKVFISSFAPAVLKKRASQLPKEEDF